MIPPPNIIAFWAIRLSTGAPLTNDEKKRMDSDARWQAKATAISAASLLVFIGLVFLCVVAAIVVRIFA